MEERDKKYEEERRDIVRDSSHLRADAKHRKNNSTRKVNKLWLWLGVLILIFILLWWLYPIGTFEAITGVDNGVV